MKQMKRRIMTGVLLLSMAWILMACGNSIDVPEYDDTMDPVKENSVFAIVTMIDDVNGKIGLRTVGYETELSLTFSAGADVQDKYGNLLPMSQVQLGSIVDATYDENRDKLISLHISDKESVEKLEGVSGAVVDNVKGTIQFNGNTVMLGNGAGAFSDNKEIALNEICTEDQVTIWSYNDVVYAVYVELGHGYVRLSDYASYIGGTVEIGYDVIVPVTEDMLLTVREGDYTLRIEKDGDVGTKEITVVKNQEADISLADIAVEPKQTGSVLFDVTPAGAAVYIDGRRVNTEGAIVLTYGKHRIAITADGYQSYSAFFNVDYAYKIKSYTLKAEDDSSTDSTTQTATTTGSSTETTTATGTTAAGTTASGSTANGGTTEKTTEQGTTEKDVTAVTGTKTSNKVTVTAPTGASVYFDGEYIGIVPISFTKVTGSHIITLSKTGYLSKSYTVNFTNDGKDQTLKFNDLTLISSLLD